MPIKILLVLLMSPHLGVDALGLARLPYKQLAGQRVVGALDSTFGDIYRPLSYLSKHGLKYIRIHLSNGTSSSHVCLPRYPLVRAGAKRLRVFSNAHPTIKVYVSPSLEHSCSYKPVVDKWFKIIKQNLPYAISVCSTVGGYCPKSTIKELHGSTVSGKIVSNDGSPRGNNHGTILNFIWSPCLNGKYSLDDNTAISERRGWCTVEQLKKLKEAYGLF